MASRNQIHQVIVLKTKVFGEIHKSLTLFSQESGIIQVTAHGTQKIKSKLRAFTEAFSRYKAYLYFNPIKNQYKLNDGENLSAFESGHTSIEKFYTASLFCEIIIKSYGGGSDHEGLFKLLKNSLEILEKINENKRVYLIIQFLHHFLTINGFSINLKTCDNCFKNLDERDFLYFYQKEEGSICASCSLKFPGESIILAPGARKYLLKTSGLEIEDSLLITLVQKTAHDLKHLLLDRIQGILEGPLNSLKQSKEFL